MPGPGETVKALDFSVSETFPWENRTARRRFSLLPSGRGRNGGHAPFFYFSLKIRDRYLNFLNNMLYCK